MFYVYTLFIYYFLLHTVYLVQFSIFVYLSGAQIMVLLPPQLCMKSFFI